MEERDLHSPIGVARLEPGALRLVHRVDHLAENIDLELLSRGVALAHRL